MVERELIFQAEPEGSCEEEEEIVHLWSRGWGGGLGDKIQYHQSKKFKIIKEFAVSVHDSPSSTQLPSGSA